MPILKFLVVAVVCLFHSALFASWDLNDVSYLMPLPTDLASTQLLKTSSEFKNGALIPRAVLEKIPPLAFAQDNEDLLTSLRVVGVRIDPCFPLPTPQSCQHQVRMVWQPFTEVRGELFGVDGSLHTFYVLSDDQFRDLAQQLQNWKKEFNVRTQGLPLQIHPAWGEFGDTSKALIAFNQIILKFTGEKNFMRITAMLLRGAGNAWIFAGFEYKNGDISILPVPRLNKNSQGFLNAAMPFDYFGGRGIQPLPEGTDTLNNLVAFSRLLEDEKSEQTILDEVKSAFRIENPKNYSPENMDCVSCHVTLPAIQWVLNKKPHLQVERLFGDQIYRNSKYSLDNVSPERWNTRIIRGFGYFNRNIAISQRVINESAEVADALNLSHPAQRSVVPKVKD